MTYAGFCDPSGGISDSMTLAVAHLRDGAVCVLDAVLECRPPFDPEVAVAECTAVLNRFGITRMIGDSMLESGLRRASPSTALALSKAPARSPTSIMICFRF